MFGDRTSFNCWTAHSKAGSAAEPGGSYRGRITVSRDIKLLQRPRQVSLVVRQQYQMTSVSADRTILEWPYEPQTYFEAPVFQGRPDYQLTISDGIATATLCCFQDPVPEPLRQEIESRVQAVFSARQLLIHQKYTIHNLRISQERSGGSRNVTVSIQGVASIALAATPDLILTDAQRHIIKDTKAERIAKHKEFIEAIADAARKHPLVSQLLQSYRAAVEDPNDEFVHLYEIREALKGHYGTEKEAKKQLGNAKWRQLGLLANEERIRQSRHRGKHGCGTTASDTQ